MLRSLALCGLIGITAPAAAQYPGGNPTGVGGPYGNVPRMAPPVSPYLNLLRGGIPAVNYFNFVRPMVQPLTPLDTQPPVASLASTFPAEDGSLDQPGQTGLMPRVTGHPTAFMSYQGYFNTFGTIGSPMQRGAIQRPPTMPVRR
jgi:hypothetical protein